jgi:hypothetical protein
MSGDTRYHEIRWNVVCPMGHPLWRWSLVPMRHREDNLLKNQAPCEGVTISPRHPMECGNLCMASTRCFARVE